MVEALPGKAPETVLPGSPVEPVRSRGPAAVRRLHPPPGRGTHPRGSASWWLRDLGAAGKGRGSIGEIRTVTALREILGVTFGRDYPAGRERKPYRRRPPNSCQRRASTDRCRGGV